MNFITQLIYFLPPFSYGGMSTPTIAIWEGELKKPSTDKKYT